VPSDVSATKSHPGWIWSRQLQSIDDAARRLRHGQSELQLAALQHMCDGLRLKQFDLQKNVLNAIGIIVQISRLIPDLMFSAL
jgi:hypothetical protein